VIFKRQTREERERRREQRERKHSERQDAKLAAARQKTARLRAEHVQRWGNDPLASHSVSPQRRREPIRQRVRDEVWRRDQGRCVDCGSRERLEYDHIVPLSKGGSNTARNIELRCERCNRRKGPRI
jgi:5-methylcytosine-specific restriction endonuclease McrA